MAVSCCSSLRPVWLVYMPEALWEPEGYLHCASPTRAAQQRRLAREPKVGSAFCLVGPYMGVTDDLPKREVP